MASSSKEAVHCVVDQSRLDSCNKFKFLPIDFVRHQVLDIEHSKGVVDNVFD